jgi:hypothetical protein
VKAGARAGRMARPFEWPAAVGARATNQKSGAQTGAGIGDGTGRRKNIMARAIELLLTLLQLGPIVVLSIRSNRLSPQLAPKFHQALNEESESNTLSS